MITYRHFRIPLLFLLVISLQLEAQGRGHRRTGARTAAMIKAQREAVIKAARAQYAQAEAVLNIAMSKGTGAQSQLSAVLSKMQASVSEMHEARTQEGDLRKDLADIEGDILREQSNDSPYAIAFSRFQDLRTEMAKRESKLLAATGYVATKAELIRNEGPAAVARFRQETLDGDTEYSGQHMRLEELAAEVNRIKRELFKNDSEWNSVHENLLAARKDAADASAEVYKESPNRAEPLRNIKDAKQAATAARVVMAQAESVLRQHNASIKPASKSASK